MSNITIQKGDTIWGLARSNGTTEDAIISANPGINPKNLKVGGTIIIPDSASNQDTAGLDIVSFGNIPKTEEKPVQTAVQPQAKPPIQSQNSSAGAKPQNNNSDVIYTVKNGDSLSKIAKANNVSSARLQKYNRIKDQNKIRVGQGLHIPPNLTEAQIKDKIKAAAKKYNIDESLILALVEHESKFDILATSHTGAAGLFQLTTIAADQVKGRKTYYVDENIETGAKYLRWCLDNTSSEEEALVAYNTGIGAMKAAKAKNTPIDSITEKKDGKGYAENIFELRKKYQPQTPPKK